MDVSTLLVAVCVGVAGLSALGVMILAGATDRNSGRHPDGRSGLVRDKLLVLAPMLLLGVMLALKGFTTLDASPLWLWAWGLVLIATFAFLWLPAVKRARLRLAATNRYPSQ